MNNINFEVTAVDIDTDVKTENPEIKISGNTFEDKLLNYLSKNRPCLYILTPCFASICYVNYVNCIMKTRDLFYKYGIELHIEFCKNDSLVSRARNNLVARAMANKKTTHILFIDNDITWNPEDILKLIIADKQLIGGVYPIKHYDWNKLIKDPSDETNTNVIQSWIDKKNRSQLKDIIPDNVFIQQKILRYNINYLGSILDIENNVAKVKHLATGFMMIKRCVIENMCKAFSSTKYVDDVGFLQQHENEYAYALFDCGVEEGHYFSEDWLFCHRWTKMGGSIYIDVSINLTHTGIEDYQGSYIGSII
jgi:hypothetical protein